MLRRKAFLGNPYGGELSNGYRVTKLWPRLPCEYAQNSKDKKYLRISTVRPGWSPDGMAHDIENADHQCFLQRPLFNTGFGGPKTPFDALQVLRIHLAMPFGSSTLLSRAAGSSRGSPLGLRRKNIQQKRKRTRITKRNQNTPLRHGIFVSTPQILDSFP